MNMFITTDVLNDWAVSGKGLAHTLLQQCIEDDSIHLWTSAVSIYEAEQVAREARGVDGAEGVLSMIRDHFSLIPFRRSVFLAAHDNIEADFRTGVQLASMDVFRMDCCIAMDVALFSSASIPVFTPEAFLDSQVNDREETFAGVPFMDLKAQHHQIYNDIDDRYTDIIANTGFILGNYVNQFEADFASLQESRYCAAVSSGTDALHIALMALEIGNGDSVIVPTHTFIATAEAVSLCGAEPLFCDCDEDYNIDVHMLQQILEDNRRSGKRRIKAIIPVHLYGRSARMAAIMALADEYNLQVLEDACQAHLASYHGKKVGNFGAFGAFSFYPGKNLGAFGEGGALITNDGGLYKKAEMIRKHGESKRYHHETVGHNYRMSALQGAALGVKLKYLPRWTSLRQNHAMRYTRLLQNIQGVTVPKDMEQAESVYHLYVIQVAERDALMDFLKEKGVTCGLHYPVPLHLQKAYAHLGYGKGDFPCAETAAKRILSLPMFPELKNCQIDYVCECIETFMAGTGKE